MDDRDIFAIIVLAGAFSTLIFSYGRALIDLNFKEENKKPTFLWGELRSTNARFTYMGWVSSELLTTISLGSSFILIYYYIKPFNWWLLNASVITYFTGTFFWYTVTTIAYCNDIRDIAAIPVLLMVLGNTIMLVTMIHPDTQPLTTDESDMIAFRMIHTMLGISFLHHLAFDVFVWYFSFVYMKSNDKDFCKPESSEASFIGTPEESPDLRKIGLKSLISSKRRVIIAGHAC